MEAHAPDPESKRLRLSTTLQEEEKVAMLITAYRDWWTPGAQPLALQLAAYTDTQIFTVGCSDEIRQAQTSRASVRKVCLRTCENAARGS